MKNYNYFFLYVMVGVYSQVLFSADEVLITQLGKLQSMLRDLNTVLITQGKKKPQEKITELDSAAFITNVKQAQRPIELISRLFESVGAVPFVAISYAPEEYVFSKEEQEEQDRLLKEFNDLLQKSEQMVDGAQWRAQLFKQLEDIQLEEIAKKPVKKGSAEDLFNKLLEKISYSARAKDLYNTLLGELGEKPPFLPREELQTPEEKNEIIAIKTEFGRITQLPDYLPLHDLIVKRLHTLAEKPEKERELPPLPQKEEEGTIPSAPPLPEKTNGGKGKLTPEEQTAKDILHEIIKKRRPAWKPEEEEEGEEEELEEFPTSGTEPEASRNGGRIISPEELERGTQEMLDRLRKEIEETEEPEKEGINRWE